MSNISPRTLAPLPHPPDVEPLHDGDGPVRFVPQAPGYEIVSIGDNPVGTIEQRAWGRVKRWGYRTSLFEAPLDFRASNRLSARIACLHRIAAWHDLAGPLYADIARRIHAQADGLST